MKPSFHIQYLERISTQEVKLHHQVEISYKYQNNGLFNFDQYNKKEVYQNLNFNFYKLLNIKDLQIEIKQNLFAKYQNDGIANINFIYSYIMKNIDSNIDFNHELGLNKANNEQSNNKSSNIVNIKTIANNIKNNLMDVEINETYNYELKPKSLEELKNFLNKNRPSKYYNVEIKNAPPQSEICQIYNYI